MVMDRRMLLSAFKALQGAYIEYKANEKIPGHLQEIDDLLLSTQKTIETFDQLYSRDSCELPGLKKPMEQLLTSLERCKVMLQDCQKKSIQNAAVSLVTGGGQSQIQQALKLLKSSQENFHAHLSLQQSLLQSQTLAQLYDLDSRFAADSTERNKFALQRMEKLEKVAAMVEGVEGRHSEILDQLQALFHCVQETHHSDRVESLTAVDLPLLQQRSLDLVDEVNLLGQQLKPILNLLTATKARFTDLQAILQDVKKNMSSLTLRLCFVGPMKAGKSTVINALCGKQLLPSAQFAMTVLPTVLAHTPGAKEPKLYFEGSDLFTPALKELKALGHQWLLAKETAKRDRDDDEEWTEVSDQIKDNDSDEDKEADLTEILLTPQEEDILKSVMKGQFTTVFGSAEGFEMVHKALLQVNHAARLFARFRRHMKADPLAGLGEVSLTWFPRVEMEFEMLRAQTESEGVGQFEIVDTPGRDEQALIPEIPLIFSQVLKDSNGAVCVCNAQLMNNDAQASVNRDLSEMKTKQLPFFVLANKFDQLEQQQDSLSKSALEDYMAEQWLGQKNMKSHKRVFALSGEKAFLSSRITCLLEETPADFMREVKSLEPGADVSGSPNSKQAKTVRQWVQVAFGDAGPWSFLKFTPDAAHQKQLFQEANGTVLQRSHFPEFVHELLVKFAPQAGATVLGSFLRVLHQKVVLPVRKDVSNLFRAMEMSKLEVEAEMQRNMRISEELESERKKAQNEMVDVLDYLMGEADSGAALIKKQMFALVEKQVSAALKKRESELADSIITPTEKDLETQAQAWPWLERSHVGKKLIMFTGDLAWHYAEMEHVNNWKVVQESMETRLISSVQYELKFNADSALRQWLSGCISRFSSLESEVGLKTSQLEPSADFDVGDIDFKTPEQISIQSEIRAKRRLGRYLWLVKRYMKEKSVVILPVDDMKNGFLETIVKKLEAWKEGVKKILKGRMDQTYAALEAQYHENLNRYSEQLKSVAERDKDFEHIGLLRALFTQLNSIEMETSELKELTDQCQVNGYLQQGQLGEGGLSVTKERTVQTEKGDQKDGTKPPSPPSDCTEGGPVASEAQANPPSPSASVADPRKWKLADVQAWLKKIEMPEKVQNAFEENSVDGEYLVNLSLEDLVGELELKPLQARKVRTKFDLLMHDIL